jgi:heme/copper-type cytochrome/quinol oxidase subunit 3
MKANRPLPQVRTGAPETTPPARVIAFPSPWEPERKTAGVGVAIACVVLAMWYLPIFASVVRGRFVHHDWPSGSAIGNTFGWGVMAVVTSLFSTVALTLAARGAAPSNVAARSGAPGFVQKFAAESWAACLVASAGFSVTTIALHYRTCTSLAELGLDLHGSPAGSSIFALVGLNLVAMAIAAVALVGMTVRLMLGKWHPARPLPLALWSVYLRCAAGLAVVGFVAAFVAV